jgi:transposase
VRHCAYGEAAAKAPPHAVQVADRWHLMENASAAFLDAVRKLMRTIRTAISATTSRNRQMAKGQKRSNREIKKPKQKKAAPTPPAAFGKGLSASKSAPKKKT